MADWTAGYVSELGYTYGYYRELNPNFVEMMLLASGISPPKFENALELGFGQGLSINIHSAAGGTNWWGTDFNPSQANFANRMAAAAGSSAALFEDSFDALLSREDLPSFDFIALHGIWSWISDENREVIVEIVKRKLNIGGVLYISYNTLPGWAMFAPMRHLMTQHAKVMGAAGSGIATRITEALGFADKLIGVNGGYARNNADLLGRLERLKGQPTHYLAHEYFNQDWHPMHFSTLADWLKPAKVEFACSAEPLNHVDAINLTEEQQHFLNNIRDPEFRESVRDFITNQPFRREYWIKGKQAMSALERAEIMRSLKVVLTVPAEKVSMEVSGTLGPATLQEGLYRPLFDLLADHVPKTLGEIEQHFSSIQVNDSDVEFAQIAQAIMILIGSGQMQLARRSDDAIATSQPTTERLNLFLANRARSNADISFVASSVTGGGIFVDRIDQMFLACLRDDQLSSRQLAEQIWSVLEAQGQKLIKDGAPIEDPEENVQQLEERADSFQIDRLPIYRTLGLI